MTRIAAKSTAFRVLEKGNVSGAPEMKRCSLPKAMKLPESVTVPIRVDRRMVIPASTPRSPPPSRKNSAAATTPEAPPRDR